MCAMVWMDKRGCQTRKPFSMSRVSSPPEHFMSTPYISLEPFTTKEYVAGFNYILLNMWPKLSK